ncbi:hypothetical protein EDC04DRAFT_641469 [Pisolithus marmoratus]|nr:hypothetical protein EDC04DRAFT_641469 [Pisolithus marmoratus]
MRLNHAIPSQQIRYIRRTEAMYKFTGRETRKRSCYGHSKATVHADATARRDLPNQAITLNFRNSHVADPSRTNHAPRIQVHLIIHWYISFIIFGLCFCLRIPPCRLRGSVGEYATSHCWRMFACLHNYLASDIALDNFPSPSVACQTTEDTYRFPS